MTDVQLLQVGQISDVVGQARDLIVIHWQFPQLSEAEEALENIKYVCHHKILQCKLNLKSTKSISLVCLSRSVTWDGQPNIF